MVIFIIFHHTYSVQKCKVKFKIKFKKSTGHHTLSKLANGTLRQQLAATLMYLHEVISRNSELMTGHYSTGLIISVFYARLDMWTVDRDGPKKLNIFYTDIWVNMVLRRVFFFFLRINVKSGLF